MALLLAELGHDVTVIDLAEGMLAVARRRAETFGLAVEWRRGDAENQPFDEGSFDAVISRHVVWTLLEPERAARAWARVTRPGGLVVAIGSLRRRDRPAEALATAAGLAWTCAATQRLLARGHTYRTEVERLLPLHHLASVAPHVRPWPAPAS
jgi:ubiquinone/menaquinone biosynthesis C-methylase UbiE